MTPPRNGQTGSIHPIASGLFAATSGPSPVPSQTPVIVTPEPLSGRAITARAASEAVSLASLYPLGEPRNVRRATELLGEILVHIERAIEADSDGERFQQADAVLHCTVRLRELFCLREIGDGFATVANALLSAVENLPGGMATMEQLHAIRQRCVRIQVEPYLSTADADVQVDRLERAGLQTEPAVLGFFLDTLSDDGRD